MLKVLNKFDRDPEIIRYSTQHRVICQPVSFEKELLAQTDFLNL